MNTEDHNTDKQVTTIVTSEVLELIDHYADQRKLYRSNWLREAISEKIQREIEVETGLDLSKVRRA